MTTVLRNIFYKFRRSLFFIQENIDILFGKSLQKSQDLILFHYYWYETYTSSVLSRFGSVEAHPDLDGEVSGLNMGHTKDFTRVHTDPQPVLVIMSWSKGNALAIKRRSSYLIQWTSRQRRYNSKNWHGCLIR